MISLTSCDLHVDVVERCAEWRVGMSRLRQDQPKTGPQKTRVGASEKECDPQSSLRDVVAMCAGHAVDEAVQP